MSATVRPGVRPPARRSKLLLAMAAVMDQLLVRMCSGSLVHIPFVPVSVFLHIDEYGVQMVRSRTGKLLFNDGLQVFVVGANNWFAVHDESWSASDRHSNGLCAQIKYGLGV